MKIHAATRLLASSLPSFNAVKKNLGVPSYELKNFCGYPSEVRKTFPEYKGYTLEDNYNFLYKHFKSQGSTYKLYRVVRVKTFKGLTNPNNKLGVHWSDVVQKGFATSDAFVVCALVPASSIDWLKTFAANIHIPAEREFYVTGEVQVAGIINLDRDVLWTNKNSTLRWRTE